MENILKQGYLKKVRPTAPESNRRSICHAILQKLEPKHWYVFLVRENVPYLEIFDKEDSCFTGQPISVIDLTECFKVTYTLSRLSKVWTFCIFVPGQIFDLEAETREQMLEWSNILENTLRNFGKIRESNEHIYSDLPLSYVPKKSGLAFEEYLEMNGAIGTTGAENGQCEVDISDYEEAPDVGGKPPHRDKGTDRLLKGAVGGSEPLERNRRESEEEISEPETTDEDLGKDFWLRNKKSSVEYANKTLSLNEAILGQPLSDLWGPNPPPLPNRKSEKDFPSFIQAVDDNAAPIAPPRRKRLGERNKDGGQEEITITSKSKGLKEVDVACLDDGYESFACTKKQEASAATSGDNWAESLDKANTIGNKTLTSEDKAMFDEWAKNSNEGDTGSTENPVCSLATQTDMPREVRNPRAPKSKPKKRGSSHGMWGLEELTHQQGRDRKKQGENHYSDFPSQTEGGDPDTLGKQIAVRTSWEAQASSWEGENHATGVRDAKSSVPTKNGQKEQIYDFGGQGAFQKAKSQVPNCNTPKRSSESETKPQRQYSTSDSLYSIPKCAKPVAGLSTEEVMGSQSGKGKVTSPSMFDYDTPPVLPQKKVGVPSKTASNQSPSSSPGGKSSGPTKGGGIDGGCSRQIPNSPSDTVLVQRPLPSLPERKREPKPFMLNLSVDEITGDKLSSPSHDGFRFEIATSDSIASSNPGTLDAVSPSRQSGTSPVASATASHSSSEDESNVYEDATGKNQAPALPPRRARAKRGQGQVNRAVSVYIPKKEEQDQCEQALIRSESQDDTKVCRSSIPGISRQVSLTDRQKVSGTRASAFTSVVPLKQSQVDMLLEEQQQPAVEVSISLQSTHGLGLVEGIGAVWVAGWHFHRYPRLGDRLHIGDQLLEVEGISITSIAHAFKVFNMTKSERVVLGIRRMPWAHILAIKRTVERERLGFTREGGTNEISYVDPLGLAARCGLPKRGLCVSGPGECNLVLTEVNCRPLNLGYKNNEVQHLLNAVGKDISITVQPVDLVKMLRKQLKKYKGYKEYLAP